MSFLRAILGVIFFYMAMQELFWGDLFGFMMLFVLSIWIFSSGKKHYTHQRSFYNQWFNSNNEITPDQNYLDGIVSILNRYGGTRPSSIFISLISSNAYIIAKADGQVTEEEMNSLRKSMVRHFGAEVNHSQIKESIRFTKEYVSGPSVKGDLKTVILYNASIFNDYVMSSLNYKQREVYLILYFQILYEIVYSVGMDHPAQNQLMTMLIRYFNLPQSILAYIKQLAYFSSQGGYSNRYSGGSGQYASHSRVNTDEYYRLFGLSPGASKDEIKKSYRKLAKEYHPDRYNNMPDELKNKAKEKFQQINQAYETLMKERR